MQCLECGNNIELYKEELRKKIKEHNIPFVCSKCGDIKFPYQPLRDIVFVWPDARPEKIGSFYLPETMNEDPKYTTAYGIAIAVGKGHYNKKSGKFIPMSLKVGNRVAFDKNAPWFMKVEDSKGKEHLVRYMGEQDIGFIEEK